VLPVWGIALVAAVLLVGTIVPGIRLWWPTRSDPIRRSDLGLALMTGALIAFAVLFIQVLVDLRARQDDQRRQAASDRQSLQISVGSPDLAGIDLSEAKLKRFYLGGKNLADADLAGAHLDEAVLKGAKLMRADLTKAIMPSADLTHATLTGATLDEADLTNARLYGAHLEGASLSDAQLDNAVLTDAYLSSDLAGASLRYATLDHAQFVEANLTDADLSGAWVADANFERAVLYGTNLTGTEKTLRTVKLGGAKYDRRTVWPKGFTPPGGPCKRAQCVYPVVKSDPSELKTFREKLATQLPEGWTVEPKDPDGITVFSRGGQAEFNGESLEAAPAWPAKACARAYERLLVQSTATFWHYQWIKVRFRNARAIARRYSYFSGPGDQHFAVDVYLVQRGLCYRFRATSSARVFGLYRSDFARLLKVLGVTPDVFRTAGRSRRTS
jgi:uncharacterized protein YjbI with pentapeptide repeats